MLANNLLLLMNPNATSRVANIDAKFANTSIPQLKITLTSTQLCRVIITDSASVVYLIAKNAQTHNILEKQAETSYIDLIITHSIRQKKLVPLPLHFNTDGHKINYLKVCILKDNFKETKHRKLTELQFIINFETSKFGLNKEMSFLSRYDTFTH